jgi:hypothetical protein
MKIDLKSALCGIVVGVLAVLVIAAETSPHQTGKYQIAGSLNYFLIIDTQTGKVWTGNFPSNGSRPVDVGFFDIKE